MSAAVLREAAAKMRSDAERATPGRWKSWGMQMLADQDGTSNVDTAILVASFMTCDEAGRPRTFDLDHAIGMQPAVALAVADWLDNLAATDEDAERVVGFSALDLTEALNVATTYLGRTAP